MNRKGISPLIATVLLIGFTIVIAAGIIMWWTGSVKSFIDKEGAEQAAQIKCSTETVLSIVSCADNTVTVKNEGTAVITAVIVRNPNGGEPVTEEIDIESGEESNVNDIGVGVGENVQVIPAILETEKSVLVACNNQLVESTC